MTVFQATRPTNIALIKYMGKQAVKQNIPANPSLSYTLDHLHTTVTLKPIDAAADSWHPETLWRVEEQQRFIRHLEFLRQTFGYVGYFELHSVNNFPSGCGLASSASSFAALTDCALQAFGKNISLDELAMLSRQGSGSSCRSFFSPWALWDEKGVASVTLPQSQLLHYVIVVSAQPKVVSSSTAHQRVTSSLLYPERSARASQRLQQLLEAFQQQDWLKAYCICWQEFQDMHALFETAAQPFGYYVPESIAVLQHIRDYWQQQKDGPLVTMDAGPNIHLLFRPDQIKMAEALKIEFTRHFQIYG